MFSRGGATPITLGLLLLLAACGSPGVDTDAAADPKRVPGLPSVGDGDSDSRGLDTTPPARAGVGEDARVPDTRRIGETSSASPDPNGFRPPSCAGKRTTRVALAGSLDREAYAPLVEWNPQDFANTANFSLGVTLYDGGSQVSAVVAFRKEPDASWQGPRRFSYHVTLDQSSLEIGSGYLDYDEWGALAHHEVTLPCAIPGAEAWPIELWFGTPTDEGGHGRDGMVGDDIMTITRASIDGAPRSLGIACPDAEGAEPSVEPARCPAAATRKLTLRANLSPGSWNPAEPWNAATPSSGVAFRAQLFAFDATGASAALDVFFTNNSGTFDYHVLLVGDPSHHELASGTLRFSDDGSLADHQVKSVLHLPQPDGSRGEPIALDFGADTEGGGNGVDGLTRFDQASWVISSTHDGHVGAPMACGPVRDGSDLSVPAPFDGGVFSQTRKPVPSEVGHMSTSLHISACLPSNQRVSLTPFDAARPFATADFSASAEAIDAQLMERRLSSHFRYLGDRRWRAHLVASEGDSSEELGVVELRLNGAGMLESLEGPTEVRLPQANGSPGPPLSLSWDQVIAWCNVGAYVAFGADGSLGIAR